MDGVSDSPGDTPTPVPPSQPSQVSTLAPNHINPEDQSVLHKFNRVLRGILREPQSSDQWSLFESTLVEITEAAKKELKIPAPKTSTESRQPPQVDDAKFLQKLYHRNRRKAIRLITTGDSTPCTVPTNQVQDFFRRRRSAKQMDPTFYTKGDQSNPVPLHSFKHAEVVSRLKKFENTAPGDDQLTYRHWRSLDPNGITLCHICNICLKYRRVPSAWKTSKTILIYKKGDPSDLANWRPISILRTIYKLYSGLLTTRLTTWLQQRKILSPAQKGFMPHDGVFEHNFLLQKYMAEARVEHFDIFMGLLDFSDAFGSVPHEAPPAALDHYGAGEGFCEIVSDMYTGVTTEVCTSEGTTDPIDLLSGVHQGDPLSGVLFDIVINPILERAEAHDTPQGRHGVVAFADDLTPLGWSQAELQGRIDTIVREGKRLSISPNPDKCVTLHLSGVAPTGARPTVFTIEGQPIRALRDGESTKFLGKPIGHQLLPPDAELQKYIDTGIKILQSMLSPWQKMDAMKIFFFSTLVFPMRMGQFKKTDWEKVDTELRPHFKRILHLPSRSTNNYIYGSTSGGACGIPITAEESQIFLIDSAFKLLTSNDLIIQTEADKDLVSTVRKRLARPPSADEICEYLSGKNDGEFARRSNAISNVWTKARIASTRFHVSWHKSDEEGLHLRLGELKITPKNRCSVAKMLRDHLRKIRDTDLQGLADQGKVIECVAESTSSHNFLRSGSFIRFADWRFIHRARLNLCPLNSCIRWKVGANQSCRRCGYPQETLPHVLNHCMRYSAAYTLRHNAIVDRIKTAAAARFTTIGENISLDNSGLRPDLVLKRNNEVFIVDVTIPFENRLQALTSAAAAKLEKYQPLAERLKRQYNYRKVSVVPFIVGSLGSWWTGNDPFMRKLCSRSYAELMRRLCVADTIRWSRDIYVQHITDRLQY